MTTAIICFLMGMVVGIVGVVAFALASANSRQKEHFDNLRRGKED